MHVFLVLRAYGWLTHDPPPPSPLSLYTKQVDANMLLDAYREVYFTGGVSSVYLWEEEEEEEAGGGGGGGSGASGSFAGCFLILKRVGSDGGEGPVGAWESSHVVQVCT